MNTKLSHLSAVSILLLSAWLLVFSSRAAAEAPPEGSASLRAPEDSELSALASRLAAQVQLSDKERDWLATKPKVHIRVGGYVPFHFVANNIPQGLNVDYMRVICKTYALDCDYVSGMNIEQSLLSMQQPDGIMVQPGFQRNAERERVAIFTRPVISSPFVIFHRKDSDPINGINDLSGRRIVVEDGYAIHRLMQRAYPQFNFVPVDNTTEAVTRLASGEADAYVSSLMTGVYATQSMGLANIEMAAPTSFEPNVLEIAVRKDVPELASMIDKLLASMSEDEHRSIRARWLNMPTRGLVSIEQVQHYAALAGAALVLLLLFVANLRIRDLKRENARRIAADQRFKEEVAARHEVSELLSIFIRNSPIYAFIKKVTPEESRIITVSENYVSMLGIPASGMTGKTMQELFPEALAASMTADDWRVISTNEVLTVEETFKERHYVTYKFPIALATGNFLAGYTIDITESRQKETALKESELRMRAMLKSMNSAIVVHAPDTHIIFSNARASQILGLSEVQMLGMQAIDPAWHFIDENGNPMKLEDYPVNRIISNRRRLENLVLGIVIPDQAEPTWVLVGGFPEYSANGELTQVIVNFHDITDRMRAEQELAQSESAFRGTFNQAAVGIAHVGLDGSWLKVNGKLCDIVGYSADELLHLTFQDITHPDDLDLDLSYVWRMLAGEISTYTMEKRYITKAGDTIWVNLTVSLIKKIDGDPDYFISVVEDITDRKRVESLLFNERERIKAILNKIGEPIFVKDNDHRIVLANPAFYEMFGVDERSAIGHTLEELVSPEEREQFLAADRRVLDTGITDVSEESLTLNGSSRTIVTTKTRFVDSLGDRYLVGSIHDVTDRNYIDAQIRIAATAFDSQEGMTVTDANATILKVNPAFTRITGYTAEEAVGQNPHILKSGRQDKDFYVRMWDRIIREGAWEGEIWNRRKDGEIYPEYLTITAVKDNAGVVTNYVATFNDITLSKASADEIKNLAFYDTLTKLPNRRLLLDRLRKALATIARSGNVGALLFLDLDNFKNLNDTLGHDIGDLLLRQVAERLTACVREGDTVARLGGDEFVVMLEDLSEKDIDAAAQAGVIANKIMVALNQPYQLDTHSYQNTPSIGITLIREDDLGVEELLKQADIAMYQSKKDGRNTVRFFDPKMQESLRERVQLENDLCQALAEMQFQLYYQIQVDSGNQPVGVEALIRWQHPERGLLNPAEFIPHAEESGLILSIGNWVLESACKMLKTWKQDERMRDLVLSINVSARQFHQPDFVTHIGERINHHGIDPTLLKLELTESLLLADIEDTIAKMRALKELGVRLSLDDFGTGYSSLQYLKRLPLEQLKIDKSFVKDIETDSDDRAIVSTIIAMAKNLKVEVIAEGVETEAQKQFLAERGCNRFQGFLFGKPQSPEQLMASLAVSELNG